MFAWALNTYLVYDTGSEIRRMKFNFKGATKICFGCQCLWSDPIKSAELRFKWVWIQVNIATDKKANNVPFSVLSYGFPDRPDPELQTSLPNYKWFQSLISVEWVADSHRLISTVIDACDKSLIDGNMQQNNYFVCLYKSISVSTSNKSQSPTAAFKCMPHRYQNIIWGQFSLKQSIKSVNLYQTKVLQSDIKDNSLIAASPCFCVSADVALPKNIP